MAKEKQTALNNPMDGDPQIQDVYERAVKKESQRLNLQPPYDYNILHIPGLRAVAADARRSENKRVQSALAQVDKIIEMYRHLVLDSPEDQELHAKVTKAADDAIAAVKRIV